MAAYLIEYRGESKRAPPPALVRRDRQEEIVQMKVTSVEKKEKSTVELMIQVEAEAFEAAIQKVYLKTRGRSSRWARMASPSRRWSLSAPR